MRGATINDLVDLFTNRISIHAPLAGRDNFSIISINGSTISIHAPHAGRDLHGLRLLLGRDISIHAPRAPCGARLYDVTWDIYGHPEFQSTRPMRGATKEKTLFSGDGGISIHAPHAGRDHLPLQLKFTRPAFQSTRPMRGATAHP